jgi:predicted transcriptional regulator
MRCSFGGLRAHCGCSPLNHFSLLLFTQALRKIELRRVAPRRGIPGVALIYESAPVSRITGSVYIRANQNISPEDVVSLAGPQDMCVVWYVAYLPGANRPSALMLANARRSQVPVQLAQVMIGPARPPQSFRYLEDKDRLGHGGWISWLESQI